MAFAPGGEPIYGRLNTDRPHQLKFNGIYILPTRTTIGAVLRAASGIPITRQANMQSSLPVFYDGRGSDGRTPWLTVTDLSLIQDIKLSGRFSGQVVLNVLNLFDQSQVTDVFRVQTRANRADRTARRLSSRASIPSSGSPRTTSSAIRASSSDSVWQAPREIRIGFKLTF